MNHLDLFASVGIVGDLTCAGVRCFGPTAQAAQLESSKKFAKEFMERHGIPTAQWRAFTKPEDACSFIMRWVEGHPLKDRCSSCLVWFGLLGWVFGGGGGFFHCVAMAVLALAL